VRPIVLTALALTLAVALPSAAEAGSRRRVRPFGSGGSATTSTPVRSDEAIQAALAKTPAGGVCVLPAGAWRSAIVVDRPLSIVGSGSGTTLDATGLGRPAIEILAGVTDVTIDGLRLVGAGSDGLAARGGNDRLTIRRTTIVGCAGFGARIEASATVVLERSTFDGNAAGGLDLVAVGGRASALAFRANRGAAASIGGKDVELVDARIESGVEGLRFAGVRVRAFRPVIRAVGVAARFVAGSDACVLSRADVRGVASLAVCEEGSVFATIEDCRCDATSSDAVRLAGLWHVVDGNVVAGAKGAAVTGRGGSLRVVDNRFRASVAEGVRLFGDGNTVEGNEIVRTGGASIAVEGHGCVVAMNSCEDSGAEGVRVQGGSNVVMGNETTGCDREGLLVAGDANTIQGNRLVDAAAAGIRVASGAGNFVASNTILRCGGAGFEDAGTGTVRDRNKID
jgi:hypothetical protein